MELDRMRQLAGVQQLNEGNGKLGVPEQPNLRVLSQGKDPMTHMQPHAPASVPSDSNLHPAGTGKKQAVGDHKPAAAVPSDSNLHMAGTGKKASGGIGSSGVAKIPSDSNLHPAGTGKKQSIREEAEQLADQIVAKVNVLGKSIVEGQEQFIEYRHDALKRILAMVSKYVD